MPFCHFSKVYEGISWDNLKEKTKLQIANNCRQLEYKEAIAITLTKAEFDIICKNISKPYDCYQKFVPLSIPNSQGIWNCITLIDKQTQRKLILYTAGRSFPLYVAMVEQTQ